MCEFIKDLIIGVIAGLISGGIVYAITKKREKEKEVYDYWSKFLFDALKHCEMYIPIETLNYMKYVKDKNGRFRNAIQSILDDINPYGHEDKVLSDKEEKISENVMIALEELNKWKSKSL